MSPLARGSINAALAAVAFMAGTVVLGWWTIPLLAAVLAMLKVRASHAASGALVAWSALLFWDATAAPIVPYAGRLGGLFNLPAVGLILVTLLFAVLLAWSAAAVVDSLKNGGN